jgi:hypothetical protein
VTRPALRVSGSLLLVAFVTVLQPAGALQLTPSPTWKWVTDRPAQQVSTPDKVPDSAFTFVRMPPGWHITMGPGGVLFDPRYFAEGQFTLESEVFHFPNSSNGEYGFFVGGTDLEGGGARYVSFALRGDGSAAAWERRAGETQMLSEWRGAEAVISTDGKGMVRNLMRLVVTKKEAILRANGLDVLILPREAIPLDGQFGFRVGQGVNLHITTLDATHRLAPTRQ